MKMCDTKPCPSCPWLKANPPTGELIPNFDINMMRNLRNTVPPKGSEEGGFYRIMACHKSIESKPFACAGYMATVGLKYNTNARLLALDRNVDTKSLLDNCESLDLYDDFHTMLSDYEGAHDMAVVQAALKKVEQLMGVPKEMLGNEE